METGKYLTNKEFLLELHRSKNSYCSFTDKTYSDYDHILTSSIDDVTPELIEEVKIKAASKLEQQNKQRAKEGLEPLSLRDFLVFRVMTARHLPLDPDRKKRGRLDNDALNYIKTPFPAFRHYAYHFATQTIEEVGRSHWKGSLDEGTWCIEHGKMTKRLAVMFMLLVDRYSRRVNWRSYTYLDEMKANALLQISQVGLLFDESKSDNPFAFFTTVIKNSFTRVVNLEKRNQNIRDDLMVMNGLNPSMTRQINDEHMQALAREVMATGVKYDADAVAETPPDEE